MPPQKRNFSSKTIKDDKKKKSITKVKAVKKPIKPTAIKKTVCKVVPRKKIIVKDKKEVNKFLEDVYETKKGNHKMNEIEMRKKHPILKFFFSLIFLGAFFAGIAWLGFFTFPGNKDFSEKDVELKIEGPKYVDLGATATYRISYANLQKNDLENVVLTVKYPDGFELTSTNPKTKNNTQNEWDLNVLDTKEKGYVEIVGKMYGSLKQEQSLRVFLNYSPENFESELQSVATLTNKIDKTSFELSMSGPDSIVVGNDVNYKFTLKTTDVILGQDLELIPQLPENFYITDSKPELEQNTKWIIMDKNSTSTAEIQEFIITGKYSETEDDKITVRGELQLYTSTNQTYSIAKTDINSILSRNDLGFNLAINGSTKDFSSTPDELLTISLRIKNSSEKDFENAKIKLWLDAPALKRISLLDWADLSDDADGDIQGIQLTNDTRRGQIVWNKRHVPALEKIESGDEVIIDINLPIKNAEEVNLNELKGYIINIASEISFEKGEIEKTISSNPINITVNSDLNFETRDSKTTEDSKEIHEVTWIINNNLHALKDIKLSADVYGDVTFVDSESVPAGELNYDENNKKIIWTIEKMPAELDVLALPFKLKINTKNLSQEILVSKVHVEAIDVVTGETISFMGDEIKL